MPITQDRLIALIKIIGDMVETHANRQRFISVELRSALEEFYSGNNKDNLASNLLARIQAIESVTSAPIATAEAIETLAREREHFRLRKQSNILAARNMQRSRIRKSKTRGNNSNSAEGNSNIEPL